MLILNMFLMLDATLPVCSPRCPDNVEAGAELPEAGEHLTAGRHALLALTVVYQDHTQVFIIDNLPKERISSELIW